jgi:DNA-binding response OmpR family regulator
MEPEFKQRRALIVDDERAIVEVLSRYLEDEGFAVTGVYDGSEAVQTALAGAFDVILLDLNLPAMSGIEIFKTIRKASDVPILMVTARDDAIDRVVGLELGADDYISKPFNPREVVARVKNIVNRVERRPAVTRVAHDVQRTGDLEIDRTGHEVRLRGAAVKLTPMEYRILDVLLRNAGAALSRSCSTASTPIRPTSSTARSTSTSRTCAIRSATTRTGRATSSPCTASATRSVRSAPYGQPAVATASAGPGAAACASSARATKTGTFERRTMHSATLPRKKRRSPRRP